MKDIFPLILLGGGLFLISKNQASASSQESGFTSMGGAGSSLMVIPTESRIGDVPATASELASSQIPVINIIESSGENTKKAQQSAYNAGFQQGLTANPTNQTKKSSTITSERTNITNKSLLGGTIEETWKNTNVDTGEVTYTKKERASDITPTISVAPKVNPINRIVTNIVSVFRNPARITGFIRGY